MENKKGWNHALVGLSYGFASQGETDWAFNLIIPLSEGPILK